MGFEMGGVVRIVGLGRGTVQCEGLAGYEAKKFKVRTEG